ncbi:hypothetical protein YC2023_006927 [Brassica napus]
MMDPLKFWILFNRFICTTFLDKKLATKANQLNTQICSGVVRRVRARPVAEGFPPPCSVFHFASRSLPSAVALFRALVKRLLLIPVTASEVRRSLLSIQLVLESRRGGVQWIWPWSLFFVAEREDCVF